MKKILCLMLLCFAYGTILYSCNYTGKKTSSLTPTNESVKPQTNTSSTKEKKNPMIATVNGRVITKIEVAREMNSLLQQIRSEVPPDQIELMKPKLWDQAVENMINFTILIQEADNENIQLDQELIDEQIEQIANQFPNFEEFHEQLVILGISEEELRKDIGENLKIETLLERQTENTPEVIERDIQEFYQDHPENFRMPERIQASHILISIDTNDTAEERSVKRQRLLQLRKEIENGGDFAHLAHEYSDCPSKSNGGDLGLFEKGEMIKPFDDAAFQLNAGEMSDIVETEFGYHLIKVTDHQKGYSIPLKEAHDKIVSFLYRQRRKQLIDDYLLKLRNAVKIEYAEDMQR